MTEVVRTKIRNISVLTTTTLLLLLGNFHLTSSYRYGNLRRQQVDLLQFGNKCSIPRQGGEVSIVTECDASKGLVCDGKACVCTFADHFSYDPFRDECRKKLGKSCRVTTALSEYLELPFHLKCHSTASCEYVSRSMNYWGRETGGRDARDMGGFSMCVCKQGYEPTEQLDGCRTPRNNFDLAPLRERDDHYDEEED